MEPLVIVLFISGLLIGGVIGALITLLRTRSTSQEALIHVAELETGLNIIKGQLQQREHELSIANATVTGLQANVARLQQAHDTDIEKLQWIEQAQTKMREAFEALAGKSLQTNSTSFIERAREQLQGVMNQVRGDWNTQKAEMRNVIDPLQLNLDTLDLRVREMEQKREGAYQRVDEQLRQLMDVNANLQHTTITLAQALKSSTVRGRWGELQLHRIAELSGMHEHISFEEQVGIVDGRPDMVVYLPNGGSIPIDSKTPMSAFIESVEASDEPTRLAKIGEHIRAVRARMQELGQKKYWDNIGTAADFVVMFVPSEACLSAAFDADSRLMEDALNLKVMMVTPITLLALLKTVAYGWQQYRINKDAQLIADEGREFYKRLKVFVDHLIDMRGSLNRTVDNYNKAIGSLEGRLLPSVRKLESMANTGQQLEPPAPVELAVRQIADAIASDK